MEKAFSLFDARVPISLGVMNEAERVNDELSPHSADRDVAVLNRLIRELSAVPEESRRRLVETICIFFRITLRDGGAGEMSRASRVSEISAPVNPFKFSENESVSPKDFMLQKAPNTDVERVACLAFYLTHFRSMPHFKTKDLSELITEAAQRRFSNAAVAVMNATNSGFLVPSVKGCKQLSAAGEQFVQALPDREVARDAFERLNWKRGRRVRKGAAKSPN